MNIEIIYLRKKQLKDSKSVQDIWKHLIFLNLFLLIYNKKVEFLSVQTQIFFFFLLFKKKKKKINLKKKKKKKKKKNIYYI